MDWNRSGDEREGMRVRANKNLWPIVIIGCVLLLALGSVRFFASPLEDIEFDIAGSIEEVYMNEAGAVAAILVQTEKSVRTIDILSARVVSPNGKLSKRALTPGISVFIALQKETGTRESYLSGAIASIVLVEPGVMVTAY